MDAAAGNHRLTDKQRALVALRRMRERLDAADRSRHEPIAIVGMSCRFPGEANSLEAYWDLLRAGRCAVTKVPSDRWDADALFDSDPSAPGKICSRYGSFVNDADCFDASFFGISGREAISMDPQQRLLLEVIWEALENAGMAPDRLAGTRTAVYTGICFNDYGRRHFFSGDVRRIDPWCGTGIAGSVASGRVSYVLGLRGPNLPVDTACSSSLVAVHLACQSLRLGEADVALAAGVNLLLSPEPSIYFTKVRALAPDGLSKTFDAAADGYGRGEGCAAVVLKRVSDAVSAGDAVLALIRGSAVNHDGRTAGLTVPNGIAQKEVIAAALDAAQVEPGCVDYVEAHGTGTLLGDPIEMHALYESLVAGVRRDRRLMVGSVKTNIGHLEAAAGLAGLIKSVLALGYAEIPPHLHLMRLNPEIAAHAPDIDIPTTRTPWPGGSRPKMAGVSAFGFSGTNAHVLLEEAPARQSVTDPAVGLLVFSAKTKPALDELRRRYIELLGRTPSGDWPAICQSAALRRSHFPHRIAVMARSAEEALRQLLGTAAPPSDTCDEPVLAATRRYLQGEPVEWSQVFGATPHAVVTLPNYPFQRERYWLDPPITSNSNGNALASHELLGRRLRSPLKQVQFESQINAGNPAWLADHRVFGEVILPASAYLEMALHAAAECQEIGRGAEVSVSRLRLLEPLRVPAPGRESVAMQLVEDAGRFRIFSLGPGEHREWVVHAEGDLSSPDALDPPVTSVKVGAIQERCPTRLDRDGFYAELRARGLQYGKQFQRIERLWLGRNEVLARLVPDESPSLFRVHPAMLDASLQALYANTEPQSGCCYVPVGFEIVRSFASVRGPCWCHATVGEGGIGELLLLSDDGTPLLQISGARFQLVDATWLQRTKSSVPVSDFYQSRWIEQPPGASMGVPARWLVVGSSDAVAADVANKLATAGCDALPARDGTIETALAEIESVGGHWGCVFVGHAGSAPDLETTTGEEILDRQERILGGLLRVTRELLRKRLDSRWCGLWVVTSRAQCVAENERTQDLEAASLWGFRRSIAAENPELRARGVDLDGLNSCAALTRELASELSSDDQIAFRGSRRFVMRLLQAPVEMNSRAVRLELDKVGQLDSLRISHAARYALGDGEIEIRVRAAGLNFRDVLAALGMYAGAAGPLGAECAGEVIRVGSGVTGLAPGDRVLALAAGSFASFVTASARLVWKIPARFDFFTAAAIPVAFLTAHCSLFEMAGLRRGERVLIHAATGGVGLAAVELALAAEAEVFATAGSEEKRALLRSMGVARAMNSRTLEFADDLDSVTRGEGIDVVLNSLTGPYIDAGLRALRPGGRFVEIGKADIRDALAVASQVPGIRYMQFDLRQVVAENPSAIHGMLTRILVELEAGRLRDLPLSIFDLEHASDAFRLMAQRKHVGKVVLQIPEPREMRVVPEATCVVTGGLGAIGRSVARWLAERGARNLVLIGRSAPGPEAATLIADLRNRNTRVEVYSADVSKASELADIFASIRRTLPPVQIVIHAAGFARDRALTELSWADCREVVAAKIAGAWNLLRISAAEPVERLVLFSSMASLFGPPGQAAYAAANEFVDALADSGKPGVLSIGWGPWSEMGMAARGGAARAERYGVRAFSADEALACLDSLALSSREGRVVALRLEPARFERAYAALGRPAWLSDIANSALPAFHTGSLVEELRALGPEQGRARLREYLTAAAARTLDTQNETIDPDRPLQDLGLDSMMAVELRNEVQRGLGADVPTTILFDYPTVNRLGDYLERRAQLWPEPSDLSQLSASEVADLLAQELASIPKVASK